MHTAVHTGMGGLVVELAGKALALLVLGAALAVAAPPPVANAAAEAHAEAETDRLTDLVRILREQGVIDDEQYAAMATKAQEKQDERAWHDRFSLWADFRARYEGFFRERDVFSRFAEAADPADRLQDRHRGRYRVRLNLRGEVTSRAAVYLRIASGGDDPRSTNQTLGSGADFDTDDVRLDLAYVTLSPFPDAELPGIQDGYLAVDLGKVKNPFTWKALGIDKLLWDGDITPEGGSLRIRGGAGPLGWFGNTGVYVIDENSSAKDPKLFGGQLGGTLDVAEHVTAGVRGSAYHFFSLDDDFFARAAAGGNFADGLARRNGSIQVVETSAFLAFDCWDLFPVKVFGSYAHNLSARSSMALPGVGREDDAWAAGLFVGDDARLVRVGAAYYVIEANVFPSMFLDSNVTDGIPNRKGWVLSAQRELFQGVELVVTAFLSDRIEGGAAFAGSALGSDRVRLQADLKFAL